MDSPNNSNHTDAYDFIAYDRSRPSLTGHGHDHERDISAPDLTPAISSPSIPPPDHGIAAWLFLAGCFLTEGLIWGILILSKNLFSSLKVKMSSR